MSTYTVPPLTDVDFALTAATPASVTNHATALTAYSAPALAAVAFALVAYTLPTFSGIDFELGDDIGGFPTQYAGLRTYYGAAVRELCLVAEADAPAGMGGVLKVDKNGTTYAVYLVETSDPNASSVRLRTSAGTKAIRLKT